MKLSDVGALLWALIVIAAVFSSLRRAARNVRGPSTLGGAPAPRPGAVPAPQAAVARETARQIVSARRVAVPPPVVAAPLPPSAPETEALPVEFLTLELFEDPSLERAAKASRPLSGRRVDWARGVVLAELLAPPLAMRESGPPTW